MYIAHIHMCIVGFMAQGKGWGGGGGGGVYFKKNLFLLCKKL
jgi:hypothetical protein